MSVRHRRARENPSGVHHLRSRSVLRSIVRSARLGPHDHVFDLGAGPGTLTAALLAAGARVTAVERDPAYARELRRRFRDAEGLVAALLDPPGPPRAGVDLVVEQGFAL